MYVAPTRFVYARYNNAENSEVYVLDADGGARTIPIGAGGDLMKIITEGNPMTGDGPLTIHPYDPLLPPNIAAELGDGALRTVTGITRSQAVKLYGEDGVARAEKRAALAGVRSQRASLLASCDWTQLADANLSAEAKEAWRQYRQSLRDITATFASPDAVVWPKRP